MFLRKQRFFLASFSCFLPHNVFLRKLSLLVLLYFYYFLLYYPVFAKLPLSVLSYFSQEKYQNCPSSADWKPSTSSVSFAGEAICRLYCGVRFLMHKCYFFFSAWCYFHSTSAIMLENSCFFEDRQAVSAAFCLWCNSVLNSLKSVRGKGFVQSGSLKIVTHQVICEKDCNFLTWLQL